MHYKSRWNITIPNVHLATLLFKSPTHPLSKAHRCFIDVARPDTHYLTTHEFRLWCQRFAVGLRKSGIQSGDRILVFSNNQLFSPVLFIGAVLAGAIYTGSNPGFGSSELAQHVINSGATYIICEESLLDTAIDGAELAGVGEDHIFIFDSHLYEQDASPDQYVYRRRNGRQTLCRYWGELIAHSEEGSKFVWEDFSTPELCNRTIALNYSSGTSGTPKGVEITHKNCVANVLQWVYPYYLNPDFEDRLIRTRWLCCLPMYHSIGQNIFIAAALQLRIPVYIMPRFNFLNMLEYTERFRITDLLLVAPIVVQLAKDPESKSGKYDLSSVEAIRSGAAPLSREVSEEAEALWKGRVNIKQGWGMTETTCSLMGWDSRDWSSTASVGELNPNCEAKIMAEDGMTELGYNQCGELWVRGQNVMKGYWNNPKATSDIKTSDGWLKTGDIVYIDNGHRFYIVDRKKELIKVHGRQVAPAELEALLLEHPAIAEVAVIGISIGDHERPRAYVVRQAGEKLSEEDIVSFLNTKVSIHKRITGGVIFCTSIPKNSSGKILRKALRTLAQKELEDM